MTRQHTATTHGGERFAAMTARVLVYLAYVYLVIVQLILGLGFVLLLFGANPSSEFTRWAYRSLDRAMGPFRGIFEPLDLGANGSVSAVFDTSILFAMVAYGIVISLLAALLDRITRWIRSIDVQRRLEAQHVAYADAATQRVESFPDAVGEATSVPAAGEVQAGNDR